MYRKQIVIVASSITTKCMRCCIGSGYTDSFTSFTDWNGVRVFQATFIGLDNYRELLRMKFLDGSFNNIKWILFLIIPVSLGLLSSGLLLYCKRVGASTRFLIWFHM